MLCCAIMACNKTTVEFTYSPANPKAGQSVRFTNQSSSGQDWLWTFGDGASSSTKSPSHVYKQAGTYRIVLKVDNNNSLTATKEITVYDTVPTFTASDSIFTIYTDYTFTANVYNPYNLDVKYLWYLPAMPADQQPYAHITDTSFTQSALHLYFIRPIREAGIGLRVIVNEDTTFIEHYYEVSDQTTNSVYIRTEEADYRQRIFGTKAEPEQQLAERALILEEAQDTFQNYNGHDFVLSELKEIFPELEGFHISHRKIYYRADGLWVASIDGANPVQIDSLDCTAMTLDTKDNRIYWANENGVWYMPFVGSDNNRFVYIPVLLNEMSSVTKLAADKVRSED